MCVVGLKPEGSMKVRPIDDMSASWINAATIVMEKLSYDTLDKYYALMRILEESVQVVLLQATGSRFA